MDREVVKLKQQGEELAQDLRITEWFRGVVGHVIRPQVIAHTALAGALFMGPNVTAHDTIALGEQQQGIEQSDGYDEGFSIFEDDLTDNRFSNETTLVDVDASENTQDEVVSEDTLLIGAFDSLGQMALGPNTADNAKLLPIKSLPGYGDKPTTNVVAKQKKSNVRLIKWRAGQDVRSTQSPVCTAGLVDFKSGGDNYVLTARHCFEVDAGGMFSDRSGTRDSASNLPVSTDNKYDFGIVIPNSDPAKTKVLPINEIAVADSADIALGRVNLSDTAIKALGLSVQRMKIGQKMPKLGTRTSSLGYTTANGLKGVRADGVYLGLERAPGQDNNVGQKYMVITLLGVDNPKEDACNKGASGGNALMGNKAIVTGPLSSRLGTRYSDGTLQSEDAANAAGYPTHLRTLSEKKHVQLSTTKNPTLCYYSHPDKAIMKSLIATVAK